MMQQINKNTASDHVCIEHLHLSLWDFDECDIRFPQKDWIKNTYSVTLTLPLAPPHSTYPQPPSFSALRKRSFIFITT